jgi:hypothetical protein
MSKNPIMANQNVPSLFALFGKGYAFEPQDIYIMIENLDYLTLFMYFEVYSCPLSQGAKSG